MRGICGIAFQDAAGDYANERLHAMARSMESLENSNCLQDDNVYLAPADDACGCLVAFNGTIYNSPELREDLAKLGHVFSSASCSELIGKAYAQWGLSCFEHFNGIFALVIWDRVQCRLLLARDPLGVKPLYVCRKRGGLLFASEVRALLASGLLDRSLDAEGMDSMLAYGSVQEPFTLVKGVRSLSAGHVLIWTAEHGVEEKAYCTLSPAETDCRVDFAERLHEELQQALRRQLVSNAPPGVFLSAGIDSAAIAGLAGNALPDLQAFTVIFKDSRFNEGEGAAETARRLGIRHNLLELDESSLRHLLPKAMDCYDQPSIDGLNTWLVSRLVRDAGVEIALSGQGGDELFAGYGGFYRQLRLLRLARLARLFPAWLVDSAAPVLLMHGGNAMEKVLASRSFALSPYFLTRQINGTSIRQQLTGRRQEVNPQWMELAFGEMYRAAGKADVINRISFWEMSSYMRSTALRDSDCMSNGLEMRMPLLDISLVKLMMKIPGAAKLDPGTPKHLLVKAAGVEGSCVKMPKRGFDIPLERILKDIFREEAAELVHNPPNGYFDGKALEAAWKHFKAGRLIWQRMWCIICALRWMQRHSIA